MIVYIIMKETKINEYSSTITEVEKSFKNKEDAYSYLLSRVSEEEENRKNMKNAIIVKLILKKNLTQNVMNQII